MHSILSQWEQAVLKSTCLRFIISMSITFSAGFSYGFNLSNVAIAVIPIQEDFPNIFSDQSASYFNSLLIGAIPGSVLFGCIFGSSVGGKLSNKLGRKCCLLIISILTVISALISAITPWFGLLMIGRILNGVAVGMASCVCTIYGAELSPIHWRGVVGFGFEFGIEIGLTFGYIIGYIFEFVFFSWRWMFGSNIIIGFVVFAQYVLSPESPSFALKAAEISSASNQDVEYIPSIEMDDKCFKRKNHISNTDLSIQDAHIVNENHNIHENQKKKEIEERISVFLIPSNQMSFEGEKIIIPYGSNDKLNMLFDDSFCKEMSNQHNISDRHPQSSFYQTMKRLFFRKKNILGLMHGIVLSIAYQLTGINAIMNFLPMVFSAAGITSHTNVMLSTFGLMLWSILIVSLSVICVRFFRRKTLLVFGLFIQSIASLALGYIILFVNKDNQGPIYLAAILMYFMGFIIGPSMSFMLFSELFDEYAVRGMAVDILTCLAWIFNFLIAMLFLPLADLMGYALIFWCFFAIGLFCCLYSCLFIPETKGSNSNTP